jgi:hypothetical protein
MRAKDFISEAHSKFPEEHSGPMTGIKRYDKLDNSNPYQMWRFLVAAAGQPLDDENGHPMSKESPTGQKMATLAYSKADQAILDATSQAMGEPGTELSSMESTEPSFTNKTSPVKAFKGYKRR